MEYCPPSQYLLPVLENDRGLLEADWVDGEQDAWQVGAHDPVRVLGPGGILL